MPMVAPVLPKHSSLLTIFAGQPQVAPPGHFPILWNRPNSLPFRLVACLHVCLSAWKTGRQLTCLTGRQLPDGPPARLASEQGDTPPARRFDRLHVCQNDCPPVRKQRTKTLGSRCRSPDCTSARELCPKRGLSRTVPTLGTTPPSPHPGKCLPVGACGRASRRARCHSHDPENLTKSMRSPRGLAANGGLTAGRRAVCRRTSRRPLAPYGVLTGCPVSARRLLFRGAETGR